VSEDRLTRKLRMLRRLAHVLAKAGRLDHACEFRRQADAVEQLLLDRCRKQEPPRLCA
jgi:hypothetical protein